MTSALRPPVTDPTPIFELFRGAHSTELLTAAVAHFGLFEHLAGGALSEDVLRGKLGLEPRPFVVLTTALRAMGFLDKDDKSNFFLTEMAKEHLVKSAPFEVTGYIGLAAEAPNVTGMVELLKNNRPLGSEPEEEGVAFIYREGEESAMEQAESARMFTLSLAGRANNVAPALAEQAPLSNAKLLLDVGGGSGIYSIACLQKNPHLKAVVWDRPEVLKVAEEEAAKHGVTDRLTCIAGDMFVDPIPEGVDSILLSNILHDWDIPECRTLVNRCAEALPAGGQLMIHDVYLNDALDGPLPIALYSASLFSFTEGRAYSAAEYRTFLETAGLKPGDILPTLVHCGVLPATKS